MERVQYLSDSSLDSPVNTCDRSTTVRRIMSMSMDRPLIGHSDSAGKNKKVFLSECHSVRRFSVKVKPFWYQNTVIVNQIVTLSGVTVTESRTCINKKLS